MINAGLPIVRALYVLSEQTDNPKLKDVVVAVRKDVEAGLSLSEALEKHPKVFSRLYVEMVKAGEIEGILDGVLLRVADQLERDQDLRRKIRSAMTYSRGSDPCDPGRLFHAHLHSACIRQAVPGPGGTLPLPADLHASLRHLDQHVRSVLLYGGMALAVVMFLRWKKSESGRKVWGRAVLRIPAKIGDVVKKATLARFARTLATLSAAGADIAGHRDNRNVLG